MWVPTAGAVFVPVDIVCRRRRRGEVRETVPDCLELSFLVSSAGAELICECSGFYSGTFEEGNES